MEYDVGMLNKQVAAWHKDIETHFAAIEELRRRIAEYNALIAEAGSDGSQNRSNG